MHRHITPHTSAERAIADEVKRSLAKGTALVQLQAAVEHLETAERSWDKFIADGKRKIKGYI